MTISPAHLLPKLNPVRAENIYLNGFIYDFIQVDNKNTTLLTVNINPTNIIFDKAKGEIRVDNMLTIKVNNKDYEALLRFLKGSDKIIGGEFADYTSYKLAFAEDAIDLGSWTGQDGNWLTADREGLLPRWDKACEYNVKNGTKDKYAPINQIHDLYIWIQKKVKLQGHKVKWVDGALSLVSKLKPVDNSGFANGLIVDDTQQILSELNLGIANYAIGKFSTLLYTYSYGTSNPVLSKKDAYEWDKSFIEYEQGVVAPPIYNKWLGTKGLQNMQAAADRGFLNFSGPLPYYSSSSAFVSGFLFGNAAPRFVDFGALVTDTQFRIDLPILMLYLDIHKPKAGGKFTFLKVDGTISDDQKTLIKPFEIK